jgi:hypothetical protein
MQIGLIEAKNKKYYALTPKYTMQLPLPERQNLHNRRSATCGRNTPRQPLPELKIGEAKGRTKTKTI